MILALWVTIGICTLANLVFTMLAFSLMYRMVQRSLDTLQNAQEGVLKALKAGQGMESKEAR